MRVRVKLFAALGRYFSNAAPGTPFDIEMADGATLADLVDRLKLPREEVNPVRKGGTLPATLSNIDIIYFYHPRHEWRGFLTG